MADIPRVTLDDGPENSDWMRCVRWSLPPYRSAEFEDWLKQAGMTLEGFHRTPMYRAAVRAGLIDAEDRWTGRGMGL